MKSSKICLIINPASSGGKTKNRAVGIVREVERCFGKNVKIHFTKSALETTESVRSYVMNGCELIIAAGGDGTIHNTVNGFFIDGRLINDDLRLGIISSGTGQGFAQSIGLPGTIKEQAEIIRHLQVSKIDLGEISSFPIGQLTVYFVNEFQVGIGGAVVRNLRLCQKYLGGRIGFGLSTLKTVFTHPNQKMVIETDTGNQISEKLTGLVIANGAFTGGGMNLAPHADPFDNYLDVLLIREQNSFQRLLNFPGIYNGSHVNNKGFSLIRAKEISIVYSDDILMEADGELIHSRPCRVKVIPSLLNVCINPTEAEYACKCNRTEEVRI